ncbi:MAG: bifunctional sugar-1-phosphate nucleotidylyltransferase/acetyltransferase [Candidatus Bathyarchaeia archaeon]|jgi:bifunctional UDP-N-acetylglucosamine pyrophosphorylase/glucosamine-1-phosphate N-acetyltransferase
MKAVILAAGEGSRMWPLAENRPKHLLPMAGKPIIGHILLALVESGISNILVVVGYHEDEIRRALGDGTEYNAHVEYVRQSALTGTASALRMAYEAVGSERFLAVYGDLVVSPHAIAMLVEKARTISRVVGIVRVLDASQYGLIELNDGHDKIVRINEKPAGMVGKVGWINSGMYVLDEDVFKAIEHTSRSKRSEYELTSSLQLLIREGKEIGAAIIQDLDWLDVGRPWELLEANRRILQNLRHVIKGKIEEGVTLKPPVYVDEGALIRAGSYVEGPVYCGKGTNIGPNARVRPCTSLEADVVIGASCDIKNSIVMKGSKIPHLSYVGDSIIGEECNLGAGTITANVRFDKRTVRLKVKGNLFDSGREKLGVLMGDRAQTGINVSLLPGVRIGSDSWIAPGAVISQDVPSRKIVLVKQSRIVKPVPRSTRVRRVA